MQADSQRHAAVQAAFERGDWAGVLMHATPLLEGSADANLHFAAGVAFLQFMRLPQALAALSRAAALAPTCLEIQSQYARAQAMTGRMEEAVVMAASALALQDEGQDAALACDTLGTVFSMAGRHGQAIAASRRAVALAPRHAGYRFNLSTALMIEGRLQEAETECEACLSLDPRHWRAWFSLVQLRKQEPGQHHVDALRTRLAECAHDPDAQLYLRMALAKSLEDLGEYPEALAQYMAGKAAHRRRLNYAPARDQTLADAILEAEQRLPAMEAVQGETSDAPIFIIGMPRSGTTLVDRVLSSHPDVQSAGELSAFETALRRQVGQGAPPLIALFSGLRADALDWKALGRDYLAEARATAGHARCFTDKLPHNFLFLGLIARALPAARIVLVRRHPMDTCLGNLRQLFALGVPRFDYSYDLLEIGAYWLQFDRLVRHWQQVLPGRIHEVMYEDLVLDQAVTSRGLLEACGLSWDPAVMFPERAAGGVATASAVQVRAPVHADALARWRRFGTGMAPLAAFLSAQGVPVD